MPRRRSSGTTFDEFEQWDILLHHSFALATHNSVLINASRLLIESREQPICGSLKRRTFTPAPKDDYCSEHAQIVAAIEDLDPQAARSTMRGHLRHIRTILPRSRRLLIKIRADGAHGVYRTFASATNGVTAPRHSNYLDTQGASVTSFASTGILGFTARLN
jgi:hypothetical protein